MPKKCADPERILPVEFARRLGVHKGSISRAITAGRLTLGDDGMLAWPDAARAWVDGSRGSAKGAAAAAADRARAALADAAPPDDLGEALRGRVTAAIGDGIAPPAGADALGDVQDEPLPADATLAMATAALTRRKAERERLRVLRERGEVVDQKEAERLVFDLARQLRNRLEQMPVREAAGMAAALGAQPAVVERLLGDAVRRMLDELAGKGA